jgi:hypothetical protein
MDPLEVLPDAKTVHSRMPVTGTSHLWVEALLSSTTKTIYGNPPRQCGRQPAKLA